MKTCIVIIDLHCDPTIPSGAGDLAGGNTYSRNLLMYLMNSPYKSVYITRKKYTYLDEYVRLSDQSDFYRIDIGDFGPIDKDELQKYHDLSLIKITDILKNYNEYRFVFHSSYWQSGMLAIKLSKRYETFYIHTILSNAKKKKLLNANDDNVPGRIEAEENIFSNAKFLICSSISEMDDMMNLYNISSHKLLLTGLPIHKAYAEPAYLRSGAVSLNTMNNVNVSKKYLFYPQPLSHDNNYSWWNNKSFVYFGRMHKNKGILQIIQAWIYVAESFGLSMPPLWIVGGAPPVIEEFRNSLASSIPLLEKYEKLNKIVWWGALPPEGVSTLLLKATAVITHSKYEAGGLVAIEAMRQGIPVIGTPNGYVNDYICNWYNGFVVEFNDIDSLSKIITLFCNQPYLTHILGKNAEQTAIKLEKEWDFFKKHLFAYGLIQNNDQQNEERLSFDYTYFNINYNLMNSYPYTNAVPSLEVLKSLIIRELDIYDFEIRKSDCSELDYEEWTVEYGSEKYTVLYFYDIIAESQMWNPIPNTDFIFSKAQRVNSCIAASKIGISGEMIYSSTKDGLVIIKDNKINYNYSIDKILNTRISSENYILPKYTLRKKCSELLENIAKYTNEDAVIANAYDELQIILETTKSDSLVSEIGIRYSKDGIVIRSDGFERLPYDKLVASEQGEFQAYIIYNHIKLGLMHVDDIYNITCTDIALKNSIHMWYKYFNIYDKLENYFVSKSYLLNTK